MTATGELPAPPVRRMPAAVPRVRSGHCSGRRRQPTRHAIRLIGVLHSGLEQTETRKRREDTWARPGATAHLRGLPVIRLSSARHSPFIEPGEACAQSGWRTTRVNSPNTVPEQSILRGTSARVSLRIVTNRPGASHRGEAARHAGRAIRTRCFGEFGFVGLMLLPVALLFASFQHAIESAQARFVMKSPRM